MRKKKKAKTKTIYKATVLDMPDEDFEINPVVCSNSRIFVPQESLCDKCIPVRIDITKLPDKLEYTVGDSIDITGIVVKAYCEDDTVWGGVPFEELLFSPAEVDGDGLVFKLFGVEVRLLGSNEETEFVARRSGYTDRKWWNNNTASVPAYGVVIDTSGNGGISVFAFSKVNPESDLWFGPFGAWPQMSRVWGNEAWATQNGTLYKGAISAGYETLAQTDDWTSLYFPPISNDEFAAFYNALYEAGTDFQVSADLEVTVSWDRGDGTILDDTFTISVAGGSDLYTDGNGLYLKKCQYIEEHHHTWVSAYGVSFNHEYYNQCYPHSLGNVDGQDYTLGYPTTMDAPPEDIPLQEFYITRYNDDTYVYGLSETRFDIHLGVLYWGDRVDSDQGYSTTTAGYIYGIGGTTTAKAEYHQWTAGVWSDYLNGVPKSTENPLLADMSNVHPI